MAKTKEKFVLSNEDKAATNDRLKQALSDAAKIDLSSVDANEEKRVELDLTGYAQRRDSQIDAFPDLVYANVDALTPNPDNPRTPAEVASGSGKWRDVILRQGYDFTAEPRITVHFDAKPKTTVHQIGKRKITVLDVKQAVMLKGHLRRAALDAIKRTNPGALGAMLPDGYVPVSVMVGLSRDAQLSILLDHGKRGSIALDWRSKLAKGIDLMREGYTQFRIGELLENGPSSQHLGQTVKRLLAIKPEDRDRIMDATNKLSQTVIRDLYDAMREDGGTFGSNYEKAAQTAGMRGGPSVEPAKTNDVRSFIGRVVAVAALAPLATILNAIFERDKIAMGKIEAQADLARQAGTLPDLSSLEAMFKLEKSKPEANEPDANEPDANEPDAIAKRGKGKGK